MAESPHDKGSQSALPLPALVAEAIGTFALVFAGCGAIVIDHVSGGQVTHVGVGLVFGLIVAAMIYATGHLSGAHLNPAVTLGFAVARHFPARRVPAYWTAQGGGALLAALALRLLFGDVAHLGATVPSGGAWQAFGLESILSALLMFVIMAVATDTRAVGQAAALAIGATVGLSALFAGPISGASMNPARSLAPALVSMTWTAQWVYLTAPLLGATGAALVYRWLRDASHAEGGCACMKPERVLILCTSNSARSQMAEGWLHHLGGDAFTVASAGTHPSMVNPRAITVMAERGIDISQHRSKSVTGFLDQPFDYVITVCDDAAEACPVFPGPAQRIHWSFPDPAAVTGSEEERLQAFRRVRDDLEARLQAWIATLSH